MYLTIQAQGDNVKAISYLLAKNPNNVYERKQKGHLVRFFYSKCTDTELDATIFITPDPLELIQNKSRSNDITHYINDREFAVSSIFTSLIRSALGTALNGQPKEEYAQWVGHRFPFRFTFGPVASSLSDQQLRALFEPIGYEVEITRPKIDYSIHIKDRSSVRTVSLSGLQTLQDGLRHLFVLIPVIDNYKHYFIDEKEIDKLERYGEGWLETHPNREFIYRQALRFKELYDLVDLADEKEKKESPEKTLRLNDLRYEKIIELLEGLKPKTVVDFGSGEGKLSAKIGFLKGIQEILAVEPSESAALKAMDRFNKLEEKEQFVMPEAIWGSLFYMDERLRDKDAIVLCEVIEHIDEQRLPKAMDTILSVYQPGALIITTPNREYNEVYDMEDHFRHADHRFEWTRVEFEGWCHKRNHQSQYELEFHGIGEEQQFFGHPTQLCIFKRKREFS
ncbi:3' terminal RNA ribose 2'-O-methyltransferase Hen1 [Planomicrobium sp. CPCC 101079]|uniref:3' terminal RNA ribose 2'-O-methyltransferase Hen1 n=1 Tax=Planomicrobium sp. CPCC 101079 TaxID=2599618 RepID=UPI0011B774A0|nr:3' terminal RNA ribose 2'-O-methyltransferase Hen1 [Planomicrobium sp. CPCC 101079]TWT09312.1 3' terminal RNA ribose 2'-O-methyltransferase Hen1 [Planomicrobium sp. CPCC 101079]